MKGKRAVKKGDVYEHPANLKAGYRIQYADKKPYVVDHVTMSYDGVTVVHTDKTSRLLSQWAEVQVLAKEEYNSEEQKLQASMPQLDGDRDPCLCPDRGGCPCGRQAQ